MNTVAVIPVFNHGDAVGAVVARLRGQGLPVILVNDGCNAACAQILQTLANTDTAAADLPPVHLLTHPENRGKGAAVMTGLACAHEQGYSHALQVDADGQHDLDAVPAFLAAADGQPEAVINACPRYDDSVPKGRLYGRYLTHVWVWINTLSLRIPDSMCGFRIYPLAAVMPLLPVLASASRMDFDTEILVRLDWAATPIVNLPVAVRYPVGGLSHFQPLRDNLRISAMHTRLFFGMLRRFPQLLARHWQGKEKTHWTEIREAGFVGGMRFLFWVYRRGGAWLFRAFLFVVMLWFFATRRLARRASLEYLRRLHRESGGATPAPTHRNSFRHFMNFADVILDKFLAFSGELENIPCHIEGRETLLSLAREKRGALLVTAHLGNLELCRRLHYSLPSDCPPPRLTVLVHTRHAESFNRMLRRLDPSHTFDLVQVTSFTPATAMLLSERIAAGGLVAIAGDRVPVAPGNATFATLEHPFLGAPAHFPIGPYVLAAALGCPVFMLFSARRDGDFFVGLRFLAERIVLPRRARREAIVPYLSAYVAALTEECRKNPLQWFNFFPFWQAPEFPV